jgi:hypothetical protein
MAEDEFKILVTVTQTKQKAHFLVVNLNTEVTYDNSVTAQCVQTLAEMIKTLHNSQLHSLQPEWLKVKMK